MLCTGYNSSFKTLEECTLFFVCLSFCLFEKDHYVVFLCLMHRSLSFLCCLCRQFHQLWIGRCSDKITQLVSWYLEPSQPQKSTSGPVRGRTGRRLSGIVWDLQQCSPLEQSPRGVLRDNSRYPSGIFTLIRPVQLVLRQDHWCRKHSMTTTHPSISIGGRPILQPTICRQHRCYERSNGELQDLTNRLEDRATAYGIEVRTEKTARPWPTARTTSVQMSLW